MARTGRLPAPLQEDISEISAFNESIADQQRKTSPWALAEMVISQAVFVVTPRTTNPITPHVNPHITRWRSSILDGSPMGRHFIRTSPATSAIH